MNIKDLVRPELLNLKPYIVSPTLDQRSREVGIPLEKITKLDVGENPYVEYLQDKKILRELNFYNYPDPFCSSLRKKLSLYTGFGVEWIICGNGSDELIDLLIRTFVTNNDEIIISPPTFPMYEFYGQLSDSRVKKIIRRRDFKIDIDGILNNINIAVNTKLVFIDSPGNPTGVVTSKEEVIQLLEQKLIVVVDEAYYEYCGKTVIDLLGKYSNLVVIRSFSKWAGLAGLRIGYLVANPKIINILMKTKSPYNVNSVAQMIAYSVLDNKERILREIKKVVILREQLISQLSKFKDLKVYPSEGAYVILKPKISALQIQKYLKENSILVKLICQPLLRNCLRINLGKEKEINKLVSLLRRFYES